MVMVHASAIAVLAASLGGSACAFVLPGAQRCSASSSFRAPRQLQAPQARHLPWKLYAQSENELSPAHSEPPANKGFRILELAGGVLSQGALVKSARFTWKLIWKTMMQELAPQSKDGSYVRPTYSFQGVLGSPEFPLEAGRYHVYVGNACPWCHRVQLALVLRGLQDVITFSGMTDDPERASRGGWAFTEALRDPVFGKNDLREVYDLCSPGYSGRCTAPVVVDRKARKIVNNESSQIVRMLNGFDLGSASGTVDFCPKNLESQIDMVNDIVYEKVNNGVYRAGFATTQEGYDKACQDVFDGLGYCEDLLSKHRFLLGDKFTEADLRLLPTAVRFDGVYATLFKCSRKRIGDYPNLKLWLRDVYQLPGVAGTIDIDDARRSYFSQLFPLNPGGIVPCGPSESDLGLKDAHGRGSVQKQEVFYCKT